MCADIFKKQKSELLVYMFALMGTKLIFLHFYTLNKPFSNLM